MPVLHEAQVTGDRLGLRAGVVAVDVVDRYCSIHVTHRGPGVHDTRQTWTLSDGRTGDRLHARGGGGGGGHRVDEPAVTSWRARWTFELDERPTSVRVRDSTGTVDIDVALRASRPVSPPCSFVWTPTVIGRRELLDRAWQTGVMTDAVPAALTAIDGDPIEAAGSELWPVAIEHWRACDLVRFRVEGDLGPTPGGVDRSMAEGPAERGLVVSYSGGADGPWLDVAYPR